MLFLAYCVASMAGSTLVILNFPVRARVLAISAEVSVWSRSCTQRLKLTLSWSMKMVPNTSISSIGKVVVKNMVVFSR